MDAPLRRLDELAEIQTGLPVRSLVSREQGEGVLVFALTPASLKTDAEITPTKQDLTYAIADLSPELRHEVHPADIYVTAKSTAESMRCALIAEAWNQDQSPCFASSLIRIRVRNRDQILPRYLHAWLSSSYGKAALYGESQSATSQLNLTATSISNVRIPIPSMTEQLKVVEFMNHAETAQLYAVEAAKARLNLAREIAFNPMNSSKQ